MRYKAKNIAALQMLLGDLPDRMRVTVEPGIGVSAKTVSELRKVTAWPENLAITIPVEHGPDDVITIGKASVATRVAPKP